MAAPKNFLPGHCQPTSDLVYLLGSLALNKCLGRYRASTGTHAPQHKPQRFRHYKLLERRRQTEIRNLPQILVIIVSYHQPFFCLYYFLLLLLSFNPERGEMSPAGTICQRPFVPKQHKRVSGALLDSGIALCRSLICAQVQKVLGLNPIKSGSMLVPCRPLTCGGGTAPAGGTCTSSSCLCYSNFLVGAAKTKLHFPSASAFAYDIFMLLVPFSFSRASKSPLAG